MRSRSATNLNFSWPLTTVLTITCLIAVNFTWGIPQEARPNATPATSQPAKKPSKSKPPKAVAKKPTPHGPAVLPDFVRIPAGSFKMGSANYESERGMGEGPVHMVTLRAFAMSATEVTRREFAQFVAETHYVTDAEKTTDRKLGCYGTVGGDKFTDTPGRNWRDPGFPQDDNHPVVCVTWNDANNYAEWKGDQLRARVRLPTEAEQEYALRAGGRTLYPWGTNLDDACGHANIGDANVKRVHPSWTTASCNDGHAQTSAVGRYPANAFGLKDMSGNVWEWVQDCFHENYTGAPTDGSTFAGGECDYRILRGGSWATIPMNLRSATRTRHAQATRPYGDAGFRLVQEL